MKSVRNDGGCCDALPFPKLMVSGHSGAVFLMRTQLEGVVVSGVAGLGAKVGEAITGDTDTFEDFNGSICLSND